MLSTMFDQVVHPRTAVRARSDDLVRSRFGEGKHVFGRVVHFLVDSLEFDADGVDEEGLEVG